MTTNSLRLNLGGTCRRCIAVLLVVAAAAGTILAVRAMSGPGALEGRDARARPSARPTVQAAFPRESYAPGQTARLVLFSQARDLSFRIFRAGTELAPTRRSDEMRGTPVAPLVRAGAVEAGRVVRIRVGNWASGLYFARLQSAGGRVGYAPFVVRPKRLGEHRVAVVLPTFTWQAYNFRDDDGDGGGDTWYADRNERFARIGRPYENRGVPPHYKSYDRPFLRWLIHTGRSVDVLSDSDLHAATGRELARAYELLIFPGHHEYVTRREYDAVNGFRDRGGNLIFLSANNFFWRVDLRGGAIWRNRKWRELGRPEAALVGVQYIGNDEGEHRGPWIVREAGARSWIFDGVGVRPGSAFSNAGIEIDRTDTSSPPGTRVLAEIPNLLGRGMTAQMTYYETRAGAKVFAAGAFTLAGSVWQAPVKRLMENLWARLASADDRGGRP
jgi:hypothetical protein